MIYKQIELDDKFHDFLMDKIYEVKSFAKSNPQMECFLSVAFPETEDSTCPDISVFLNYQPNYNISQELKDSLIEERKLYIDSMKLMMGDSEYIKSLEDEAYSWELSCYGSHSIGLSLEQFRKLEAAWKAINRDDKIDNILS